MKLLAFHSCFLSPFNMSATILTNRFPVSPEGMSYIMDGKTNRRL
jgi:hypothetical protein